MPKFDESTGFNKKTKIRQKGNITELYSTFNSEPRRESSKLFSKPKSELVLPLKSANLSTLSLALSNLILQNLLRQRNHKYMGERYTLELDEQVRN